MASNLVTAGKITTRARRRQLLLPEAAPERALITWMLEAIKGLRHAQPMKNRD
nr:hypothetical protein [Arthrobacter sp. MA-N2]